MYGCAAVASGECGSEVQSVAHVGGGHVVGVVVLGDDLCVYCAGGIHTLTGLGTAEHTNRQLLA